MFMFRFVALAFLLTTCGPDETISGFADPQASYRLVSLDGDTIVASATIRFPEPGQVTGTGPCNSFNAAQRVPYPWFELGPIASTRRACPDLEAETAYFAALAEMRFAEVVGDTLLLSNEADREMVFQVE